MPGCSSCRATVLLGIFFLLFNACMASKRTEIDGALNQSSQYFRAGEYQKAIDAFRTAHAKYPEDKPLLHSYHKSVEGIKSSADKAYEREQYVSAGRSYRLLQKNYQHFRHFTQQLSFDREYLNTKIAFCSDYLFKRGVEEYRSGEIQRAISIWKDLLSFDPENAQAKKAYDSGTAQLKNLPKVK